MFSKASLSLHSADAVGKHLRLHHTTYQIIVRYDQYSLWRVRWVIQGQPWHIHAEKAPMSFPNGLHLDDSSDTLKQYHSTEGPLEPAAHEGQLARPPADLLRRHPHQGLSAALPPLQHHLLASLSRLRLLDHDPMVHDSIPPDRRSIFTHVSLGQNQ